MKLKTFYADANARITQNRGFDGRIMSVCKHIPGTTGPIFTKCFVLIPCGHGLVLFWQLCDMLCTF